MNSEENKINSANKYLAKFNEANGTFVPLRFRVKEARKERAELRKSGASPEVIKAFDRVIDILDAEKLGNAHRGF